MEQLGRNYPLSSMWTSFFPITRTIMLMVALSFIGIQKFVFLFARLWEITPWSVVLQFAFQFRCSNFAWVLISNLRSFLEDFVFSTTYLTDHSTIHVCGKTYDQTPHNDRFCPVCNSGIIEDEFHFLLHCPKYSIPRDKFYNQIQHYLSILINYLPRNY